MRRDVTLALTIAGLLCLLLLGGCGKKEVTPYGGAAAGAKNMPEGKAITYPPPEGASLAGESGPTEETLDAAAPQGEQLDRFSLDGGLANASDEYKLAHGRSSEGLKPIYFDFDQAVIRDDQIPNLEHNAEYMKAHPEARLVVEGNCDERGTNEYNLALGERRAINARNYLVELGVAPERIRTVSYGEERPLFLGSDESAWAGNRRADFVVE